MPEQGLKFRPGKYAVFVLFCLLVPLAFMSCRERAWGSTREEILARLHDGDSTFLAEVDPSDAAQALKIGMDAPWYLAQHAASAGNTALAAALLDIGSRYSPDPFNQLCLRDLARTGSFVQRREAIEQLDQSAIFFPGFDQELPHLKTLLLVDEQRYTGIPGGLVSFFARERYTSSVIEAGKKVPAAEYPGFADVFAFRHLSEQRAYGPAWEAGKKLYAAEVPELFYRTMLSDLGKAALYGSRDSGEALELFSALNERIKEIGAVDAEYAEEAVPYMISFYRGRILAREGPSFSDEARTCFLEARQLATTPFDQDVALWYLLDLYSGDPDRLALELTSSVREWNDPSFFSGIVDRLIVQFVQDRDFRAIGRLYADTHEYLDRETHARISYIAAKSGSLSGSAAEEAFNTAYSEDHESLYYRMLASAERGSVPDAPSLVYSSRSDTRPSSAERTVALESVLRGFIVYSLPDRLFPFARDHYPEISVQTAMSLADSLVDKGFHTAALRLMVLAVRSENGPVTDEQLAYLYPRPWLEEVSAAADQFGIPEYLLYALVRTESFFNASVVSHAGAIGLTQLMGPTAGDVARKLKIKDYDLTDPGTNLVFGAYYLAELIQRLDGNIMASLFSYNAGLTRVRAWMRQGNDLDPVLFLESIPFEETRGYGRKVLAASIIYGYLYYQKSPGEIIRELF